MKRNRNFLVAISALALMTACKKTENKEVQEKSNEPKKEAESNQFSREQLIGSWVQPNPINSKEVQGFTLLENGEAKSINMATLLYEKWWINNNELFLVETSIGNHQQSTDTSSYKIIKLDSHNLSIKYGNGSDQLVEVYSKKK
jgi:hypothetical protein